MMQNPTPFDAMAKTYDADFTTSNIGRMQRNRVWTLLTPLLNETPGSLKILEINCGTGEDAIRLAAMGHHVVATDASSAMIKIAKEKNGGSSVTLSNLQFTVCPFDRLSETFSTEQFDLVFSNFGGLNCIDADSLSSLSKVLSGLTHAKGKLFLVLLGKCCLREIVHYGIRGKFRTAFRRIKRSQPFRSNGQTMPVYYYSPGALKKIFAPEFTRVKKMPVGLFIPPTYLEEKFTNKLTTLKKLEKREIQFGYPLFSGLADHYCAVFNKNFRKT